MTAAYPYQQNDFEGPGEGYVRYSVRPDLGGAVAAGEVISVSGQAYHRSWAHACVELALSVNGRIFCVQANQSLPRGRVTAFNLTYTVPAEMAAAIETGRAADISLQFTLWRQKDADGTGDAMRPAAPQTLRLLKYRLAPVIEEARFTRCREGDDGWEAHDEGLEAMCTALRVSLAEAASPADASVCRLTYTDAAGEAQVVALDPAALLEGVYEREPGLLRGARFLLGRDHALTVTVGDEFDTTQAVVMLPRAYANFHQSGAARGGAAFGMFSGSTDSDALLESAYPLHAYAGIYGADGARLDGVSAHEVTEFGSRFEAYSAGYVPRVLRAGRLVQLDGACTPVETITGSTAEELLFALPRAFWPKVIVNQVCQGSNGATWLLRVGADGLVTMSRYRSGAAFAEAQPGNWLPFHATWIASDYAGPAVVHRPVRAMRARRDRGCVASASSSYGASWPVWRGFDFNELTGWQSAAADAAPWLQLQMDVALKNIVVRVYARDAGAPNNPTSGRVLAGNDGAAWTEIGRFSGWSDSQSGGLLGEVDCRNAAAYAYVRLAIDGRGRSGSPVGVGYMAVKGEVEGS